MAKRIDDLLLVKIASRLDAFKGKVARAGFFAGKEYASGPSVAYVAAIQEYGDPSHHIPPRPFMHIAVKKEHTQWTDDARRGVRAILHGSSTPENVLNQIGGVMAADIQTSISNLYAPPLSPITVMLRGMRRNDTNLTVTGKTVGMAAQRVAEKKTDYGASDKPLVDTGEMLASVSFKVGSV